MTRSPGLPQAVLATALLMSFLCLPGRAAEVCRTECGWLKFSDFTKQVEDCGARSELGQCQQLAEGHYTASSPCQVRMDLSPLGPGSKVSSVEHKGDSSWSFTGKTLIFKVKTGIIVKRVKLLRPPDQCESH